ncbi:MULTISPECIES: helix-turn-helix domain-containing protein [Comamonas]|uniref:helix-turn-helix domain-containing protein n=1 Tax=Comamonas TaxID=283 RepID=UPI0012C91960|nr:MULTISPECIES: helix-turn-helix domain-containing protein [Comamonas]MEB5966323.1 helix-turn-helix domain-containing protein [Comamonas testosteroni]MPS93474.1 helix-turn-helix domain-containing protein [Comamonas sp.]
MNEASMIGAPQIHLPGLAGMLRRSFFPLDISTHPDTPFRADVRLGEFSRCRLADVQASAHTASMSRQSCGQLERRYVKIVWQQQGHVQLVQQGLQLDLQPGGWTVYEASQPYELSTAEDTVFTALLCESHGQDELLRLAQQAAGQAMPIQGGAAVALSTLRAMCGENGLLPRQSSSLAVDFVISLLSREMLLRDSGAATRRRSAQEALLQEAQAYLRCHLGEHHLSPDSIASTLCVSRRTLYHAFELAGETPQALIRRLRLERCRDALTRADTAGSSITQLALEFGFADPAYFSRAFRQRFGCTPSQYRRQALSAAAPH